MKNTPFISKIILRIVVASFVIFAVVVLTELSTNLILHSMEKGSVMGKPNTKWVSKDDSISIEIGDSCADLPDWAISGTCTIKNHNVNTTFEITNDTYGLCGFRVLLSDNQHISIRTYLLSEESFLMCVYSVYPQEPMNKDFPLRRGKWIKFYRIDE